MYKDEFVWERVTHKITTFVIKNRHLAPLHTSAGAAFVALVAAEYGINADEYKKWAMTQINYILGDNKQHMSFEIGFGSNYPKRPHHRAR